MKLSKNFLNPFCKDTKKIYKKKLKVLILHLTELIICIIIFCKISLSRGGSYIDSPKWLKNKKSTVNQKNNDNKCFQYAVTLALNIDKINDHPERISKIKPFIEKYN